MARTDPRPNYGKKRRIRLDGYVDVWEPTHRLARRDGYLMEHRKLAWDAGLFNDPALQIHHVNGVRDDNRLDNFVILGGADHARQHAEERGIITNQHGTWPVKPRDQRVTAPKPERPCRFCGTTIPTKMRRDAAYCSSGCRITAWKHDHR